MRSSKINLNVVNLILAIVLVLIVAVRFGTMDANASGNWKGYAVFRDGVALNLNDHAAIVNLNNLYDMDAIIHAPGGDDGVVEITRWSIFLNGHSFSALCKPNNCSMTQTYIDMFVSKARELQGIPYYFWSQILYDAGSNYWVYAEDVTNLRCDGVVEYTYEWYSFRVGGADNKWDITRNNSNNFNEHMLFYITPRKQWQELLTPVSTTSPI